MSYSKIIFNTASVFLSITLILPVHVFLIGSHVQIFADEEQAEETSVLVEESNEEANTEQTEQQEEESTPPVSEEEIEDPLAGTEAGKDKDESTEDNEEEVEVITEEEGEENVLVVESEDEPTPEEKVEDKAEEGEVNEEEETTENEEEEDTGDVTETIESEEEVVTSEDEEENTEVSQNRGSGGPSALVVSQDEESNEENEEEEKDNLDLLSFTLFSQEMSIYAPNEYKGEYQCEYDDYEMCYYEEETGAIHGFKYLDLDQDGVRDDDEPGLPGWEIQLFEAPNAPWKEGAEGDPLETTFTNEDGEYWFMDLPLGTYQVFEVEQEGWIQTGPGLTDNHGLTTPPFDGANVLPDTLVPGLVEPDTPADDPAVKWIQTKLANNPTMLEILARAINCIFLNECEETDTLREIKYYSILLESEYSEVYGADFGNYDTSEEVGSIHGMKYLDLDQDGEKDDDEPGLPGWTIELYQAPNAPWKEGAEGQPATSTVTMEDGWYWFENLEPGVYQVFEVLKPGWEQTGPPYTSPGAILPPDTFDGGNVLPSDLIEPSIEWLSAKLTQNPTMQKVVDCVANEGPECETLVPELLDLRYYSVYLEEGNEIDEAHFGNFKETGEIHGVKYHDLNENGVRDDDEPGLPGWTIELYQAPNAPWKGVPNNVPFAATTTMEDGMYWFIDLPPGVYQVFEVQQFGWEQTGPPLTENGGLTAPPFDGGNVLPTSLTPTTTPVSWMQTKLLENPTLQKITECSFFPGDVECKTLVPELRNLLYYTVLIEQGETIEDADFGNIKVLGSIHGFKYHDLNGNGTQDEEEPVLPGWEIELYKHPNAPWKEGAEGQPATSTVTMEDGWYWFENLEPGVYQVFEVLKPGWIQTEPATTTDNGLNPPFDGGNVLPKTLTPTSSPETWIETKLLENATMQRLTHCAFFPEDVECQTQVPELKNLFYYTVFVEKGDEIEDAIFGNLQVEELEIFDEENGEPQEEEVTVTWSTNLPATSRVVYGTTSVSDGDAQAAGPELYGYDATTATDTTKVTNHSVTITGLTPDTTYFWRPVSSASPEKLGDEGTFTTTEGEEEENGGSNNNGGGGQGGTETGGGGGGSTGGGPPSLIGGSGGGGGPFTPTGGGGGQGTVSTLVIPPVTGPIAQGGTGGSEAPAGGTGGTGTPQEPSATTTEDEPEQEEPRTDQLALLAFIGFECPWWVALIALVVLIAGALYLFQRHNKKKEAIIGLLVGIIVFYFLGNLSCNLLLALLALIVILLIGWDVRHRRINA